MGGNSWCKPTPLLAGKYIFIFIIAIVTSISAQDLSSSVYIGVADGTNVGGLFGVGTELFLNEHFSANLAVGSIHTMLEKDVDESKFDFDIGIKYYLLKYFFFGINYGFLDFHYSEIGSYKGYIISFEKIRGFSFTMGARTPNYKSFYLSAFVGITGIEEVNYYSIFEKKSFAPRIGILLGYCFK